MNKKVTDLLLVLTLMAAIGFLVYLQVRDEGVLKISNTTATNAATFASIPTDTRAPNLIPSFAPTRTPVRTQTFTFTPSPTKTLIPKTTATLPPASSASPVRSATLLPTDAEIQEGIEQGNQIVNAIEAYTQARGFYPAALSDLVPDYLSELPLTISDQPFFYRVFEPTNVMSLEIYWVAFRVVSRENVTCTYYRRLQHWDCNFASP